MSDFRTLSDRMLASPQITVADLAEAQRRGVTMVINNRPEGEAPDQTPGPDIAAAAAALGIAYRAIPVDHSGFSQHQVDAMRDALDSAQGTTLAYCRSGTRSTILWALARASEGADPARIAEAAAAAGYDLSSVRPTLNMLAAGREG